MYRLVYIVLALLAAIGSYADDANDAIKAALKGMSQTSRKVPHSAAIEAMYLGYDAKGDIKVGIAVREIKTFKDITGIVIVHQTTEGFKIHEAQFPDLHKIRSAKDRQQVESILKMFKNKPFDPHVEKSAVDGLTGATKYGLRISGYFNYMARKTALEMKANPDWPKTAIE